MLFLVFQLGDDRYALESSRVVEVVPLLDLKKIPQAPKGIAGLFNFRGRPVPAVDLCELAVNRRAAERLSTRIIVVNYPDAGGNPRLLGLIAENATGTIRKDSAEFVDPQMNVPAARYLGPVAMDSQGLVQWIREERLLTDTVRDLLFSETCPAAP